MNKTEFTAAIQLLKDKKEYTFEDLTLLIKALRSPYGCPWDAEQTHKSIRANLIDETYELVEAIDTDDTALLREETGDVLLQTVFHTVISEGEGRYCMSDVLNELCEKLIVRHPHVFGDVEVDGAESVLKNWDKIKSDIKGRKTIGDKMKSIPKSLPALMRADEVGAKSKKANFDFSSPEAAEAKVREELREVMCADAEQRAGEIGDLLFSVVNLARSLGVEPEEALNKATDKFIGRFCELETQAAAKGLDVKNLTARESDIIWEEIKKKEKK